MIPDAALLQHSAIVGIAGSGKTYTSKGFVERLLDDEQSHVVVVDPTGAWWGLRSSSNGKQAGFPVVVFGGDHADVPVPEGAGDALARQVVQRRISCVVDVSEFTMAGRRRFLTAFLGTLYEVNRSPLHLVLDEADLMAPQKPGNDGTTLLGLTEQIVRRGRIRGLRVMMITQRPAVLNKNVLSQAAMLVAMKLTAPQDRAALGAWIDGQADREEGKRLLATLPQLKQGEGWAWWPGGGLLERMTFPRIATFDSSRTPEPGDAVPAAPVLAPVDVDALRDLFAEKPKPATKTKAPPPADITEQLRAAERRGYERGCRETTEALDASNAVLARMDRIGESFSREVAEFKALVGASALKAATAQPLRTRTATPPIRERPAEGIGRGTGAHLRILKVLAQRHPARFTATQWATLAGMKQTGGTWGTYVSRLRSAGYLEQSDGLFCSTDAGLEAVGHIANQPQAAGDVMEMWKNSLGAGPARMLDALAEMGERGGLTRSDLAIAVNMEPKGGTFGTYLSRLRSNGLIEVKDGIIWLSDMLRVA